LGTEICFAPEKAGVLAGYLRRCSPRFYSSRFWLGTAPTSGRASLGTEICFAPGMPVSGMVFCVGAVPVVSLRDNGLGLFVGEVKDEIAPRAFVTGDARDMVRRIHRLIGREILGGPFGIENLNIDVVVGLVVRT